MIRTRGPASPMHPILHATWTYSILWGGCNGDITSQALAHAYGEMALSSRYGAYNYTSDILKSKYNLHIASTSIILRISRESTRDSRNESSQPRLANASITQWSAGLKMNRMEICSTSTPMVFLVATSLFQDKVELLTVPRTSIEASTPYKRRLHTDAALDVCRCGPTKLAAMASHLPSTSIQSQ